MSDKSKYKKDKIRDIFRYHRDELSGEERNSFEKELQKDRFTEEASEGLSYISESEARKDINKLRKQLGRRTATWKRTAIYRLAASVAVLMIISSLYLLIRTPGTEKQLADNSKIITTLEIPLNQPVSAPIVTQSDKDKQTMVSSKKSDNQLPVNQSPEAVSKRSVNGKLDIRETGKAEEVQEYKTELNKVTVSDTRRAAPVNESAKLKAISESAYTANGIVVSSEDNMPVPGATVNIKGTSEAAITDLSGNFRINLPDSGLKSLVVSCIGMESKTIEIKPDSEIKVLLNPSLTSLSEVVVVGYGVNRNDTDQEDSAASHNPPQPEGGISKFNKYIMNNLHRSGNLLSGKKAVVIVSLIVHIDGTFDNIKIVRSPGQDFSNEAIRVLKSGPSWIPAQENGKSVEDSVRVRMVFR